MLYDIKFALRNFRRQKVFSIINILGLTIGLTGCLLACLWVQDELKFDQHFTNTENVYQLKGNNADAKNISTGQPGIFLPLILEKLPEIESGNRIIEHSCNIGYNNKHFIENNFIYTDSNFFKFYGWELLAGDQDKVLNVPFTVVISEKKAKELFGKDNPVGKALSFELAYTLIITGIFKDIPNQSHIKADFIASISSLNKINLGELQHWGNFGSLLYLKPAPNAKIPDVMIKLSKLWNENPLNTCCGEKGANVKMYLQPFRKIYYQDVTTTGVKAGNSLYIIGFSIIASVLLVIALFNFINLAIAQLASRFLEAGIKKVIGANFFRLSKQLFSETSLYVLIALLLSNILLIALLPWFNSFTGKSLEFGVFNNPVFLIFNVSIFIFSVLCTGLYPSIYFARIRPIAIINSGKGGLLSKLGKRSHFWDTLVVIQFTLAIILIISTILVNKQLFYIRNTDPGFERENIVNIENGWSDQAKKRYQQYREQVLKFPEVVMVSSGLNVPPNNIWNAGAPTPVGSGKLINHCGFLSVDYDYFKLLGCKIKEGRDFNKTLATDEEKCIVTETFKKKLEAANPIGIVLDNLWDGKKREIIGVVNDINYSTIHDEIRPEIFFLHHPGLATHYNILIKFKTADTKTFLSKLEKLWLSLAPQEPFTYFFVDEKFEANYRREIQIAKILNILSGIAIFLCCLGLFGLALFVVNNRTKEIGIRKINGASITQVLATVNTAFIQWIALAYLIASPIAYLLIKAWLHDFAYKTPISAWIFILAAIITVLVTFITVSLHSWRAATKNPVETLRYE